MRGIQRLSKEWHQILVIYDVEENKVRNKIVRILESYGVRVQKSAFVCHVDDKRLSVMKSKLDKVIGESDSIRIYQIRSSCFDITEFDDVQVYSSKTVII